MVDIEGVLPGGCLRLLSVDHADVDRPRQTGRSEGGRVDAIRSVRGCVDNRSRDLCETGERISGRPACRVGRVVEVEIIKLAPSSDGPEPLQVQLVARSGWHGLELPGMPEAVIPPRQLLPDGLPDVVGLLGAAIGARDHCSDIAGEGVVADSDGGGEDEQAIERQRVLETISGQLTINDFHAVGHLGDAEVGGLELVGVGRVCDGDDGGRASLGVGAETRRGAFGGGEIELIVGAGVAETLHAQVEVEAEGHP